MTKPYVYIISWTDLDVHYCGVRYRKNCDPSDLWKTYFTSSKHVKNFVSINGNPDRIEIVKTFEDSMEARLFEQNVLTENDVLNKENWLNKAIGGHFAGTSGPHSEETKQKISIANKGRVKGPLSDEIRRKIALSNLGKKRSKETCERIRTAKLSMTEETKSKISETLTGSEMSEEAKEKISAHSKQRRWFNNGSHSVFRIDCPNGYIIGRIPMGPRQKR